MRVDNAKIIMKIAILNFQHAVQSSVVGPYDILTQTNDIIYSFGDDIPKFDLDVEILTSPEFEKTNQVTPTVQSNTKFNNTTVFDLVIIPAMTFTQINEVLERETELIKWIAWQYKQGSEIASICLGAFLLAETGLLDNMNASTHWMGAELFRSMFPQINLLEDKLITDQNRLYTCGGAYSFTSLMVYLIEKYFGHDVAVLVSKVFLIHVHDSTQSNFSILHIQKNHNNNAIKKVQKYIETNYEKNPGINKLAKLAYMSPRTFIRQFKSATANTPYEYLQIVRVENAKKLLEQNDANIEGICYNVGYSDVAAFRKIFKRNVGLTPSGYRKKYGRMFQPSFVAS